MNQKTHNERCRVCKSNLYNLLTATFAGVEVNWDLNIPSKLKEYIHTELAEELGLIYEALQQNRGFDSFLKSAKLPRVDYFIPSSGLIIEFDESQHFTKPREITFDHYPNDLEVGFSMAKWTSLCRTLNKKDNNPPYRDEQRAWYDTIRDFAPKLLGTGKTIRLYSHDDIWCSFNPKVESDLLRFKKMLFS